MSNCLVCGIGIDEFDSAYYSRSMLCIPCYTRKASEIPMAGCQRCGVRVRQDEIRQRRGSYYCNYCLSEIERIDRLPECYLCAKKIREHEKSIKTSGMRPVHASCAEKYASERSVTAICSACLKETKFYKVMPDGRALCLSCGRLSPQELASEQGQEPGGGHPLMGRLVTRLRGIFAGKPAEAQPQPSVANAIERMAWKRMALRNTPSI